MKIQIIAPAPPFTRGSQIKANDKRLTNSKGGMYQHDFSEDELEYLLGEKDYQKAQEGKFEFDIPKWKLDVVEGMSNSAKREHLIFSLGYSEL